ncbi:MAG: restriction endonuclease subunit R [Symploca sp. SIO2E9]|nr:restriction endonuclease subunit R [Symploca sp. SIO2E9]
MVKIIQASELSLHEVKERFNLQEVGDDSFFWEWQGNLPEITDNEKRWLDQIKADFVSLAEYPLHEEVVKLFVLAPLLSLAGLARLPFLTVAEKQIEISFDEDNQVIRGRINLLIIYRQLWVVVIESKSKRLDVMEALPQTLFYMMGTPNQEQPTFGLLSNGNRFIFVKLMQRGELRYALSEDFSLQSRRNQLYEVLAILKQLKGLVQGG